jgi:hypothetical protein
MHSQQNIKNILQALLAINKRPSLRNYLTFSVDITLSRAQGTKIFAAAITHVITLGYRMSLHVVKEGDVDI